MNYRGLADVEKRNDVLHYLKKKKKKKKEKAFIVYKKHTFQKKYSLVTSEWGYKAYFNSSTSSKKGLAILINNNFEFTFVKLVTDDKGDFMLLQLKINYQTFTLVNLHSPNKDDPDFCDRVMGELKNACSQELILK